MATGQDGEGRGVEMEGQREDISTHRKNIPNQGWKNTRTGFCFRENMQMAFKNKKIKNPGLKVA